MPFLDDLLPRALSEGPHILGLFLIPFSGGVPAGVMYGKEHGVAWQTLEGLYFISDLLLACAFEPLMRHFARKSRQAPWGQKLREAWDQSTGKVIALYGVKPGPVSLVFITFGTDPMTGRIAAYLSGHGFLTGWAISITGDMLFVSAVMASTLWLNNVLGNGTAAAVIVTIAVLALPLGLRAVRERYRRNRPGPRA